MPDRRSAGRPDVGVRRGWLIDATICVGLAVTVVGTFLPWARSGSASRNVYAAGGLVERLVGVHGLSAALLDALPFLGLACAAVVALIVLGHGADLPVVTILGRVGAVAVALGVAGGAVATLRSGRHFGVVAAGAGPGVALVGSVVVLAGCTGSVLYARFH